MILVRDRDSGRPLLHRPGRRCSQAVHFQSGRIHAAGTEWCEDVTHISCACSRSWTSTVRVRGGVFSDCDWLRRSRRFQLAVWEAAAAIPYGQTVSYAELAGRLGTPLVHAPCGLANGANLLPIIVPCHRVIGADGSLTGFGGGLYIKRRCCRSKVRRGVADLLAHTSSGVPCVVSACEPWRLPEFRRHVRFSLSAYLSIAARERIRAHPARHRHRSVLGPRPFTLGRGHRPRGGRCTFHCVCAAFVFYSSSRPARRR